MVQANRQYGGKTPDGASTESNGQLGTCDGADAEVGFAARKRDFAFRTSAVSPSRKLGSVYYVVRGI
jgi:hypothetical protein